MKYLFGLLLSLLLMASLARADAVYTYTGNPITNTGKNAFDQPCPATCRITGSVTFEKPLPPNLSMESVEPETFTFNVSGLGNQPSVAYDEFFRTGDSFTFTEYRSSVQPPLLTRPWVLADTSFSTDSSGRISDWAVEMFLCYVDCNLANEVEINGPGLDPTWSGDGFGQCGGPISECSYGNHSPGTWALGLQSPPVACSH